METCGCVHVRLMDQPLCTRLTCEGPDMAECLSALDSRGLRMRLRPRGHLRGAERWSPQLAALSSGFCDHGRLGVLHSRWWGKRVGGGGTVGGSEATGGEEEGSTGRGAARAVGSGLTCLVAPPGGSSHGNNSNTHWAPSIRHLICASQHPRRWVPHCPQFWDKEMRSSGVTDEPTSQGWSVAGELQAWLLAVTAAVQGAGVGLDIPIVKNQKPRKLVCFFEQNDRKRFQFMHEKRHNFVTG